MSYHRRVKHEMKNEEKKDEGQVEVGSRGEAQHGGDSDWIN
jgi:hypothetical protein